MRAALSKTAIESQLTSRFGDDIFKLNDHGYGEVMSTGLPEIDALAGGFPRGTITEIYGSDSSGRTSLMLSAMAHATTHDEVCALVDTSDVLEPNSAVNAAIDLEKLLWIRCAGNLEHSFKAIDLLLQGGGFGLVVLDLGDVPPQEARRIISSWWYRFRRVVENTPTAFVVIAQDSCVRSCASLALQLKREADVWSSANVIAPINSNRLSLVTRQPSREKPTHSDLLSIIQLQISRQKPVHLGVGEIQFRA